MRWTELVYNLSVIDESVVNSLPQKDINHEMMDQPTISEIHRTIKKVNTRKSPGLDEIPVEVLRYEGDKIAVEVHRLISDVWLGDPVPH